MESIGYKVLGSMIRFAQSILLMVDLYKKKRTAGCGSLFIVV
jgi:hypothetical protein